MFQSTFVLAKRDILTRRLCLGKTELYPIIFPLFSQTCSHKNHIHLFFPLLTRILDVIPLLLP